jgi:heme/copper-type cytochrome/quinol oxidase subunit 2
MVPLRSRRGAALAAGLIGFGVGLTGGVLTSRVGVTTLLAQEQAPTRRELTITARKYGYAPSRIEVTQDDLVKVTINVPGDDIPHSFTIDGYRIAKRVGAGQTVTFEFRADQAGTFPIYCNLRQDERCREMKGTLVVKPR